MQRLLASLILSYGNVLVLATLVIGVTLVAGIGWQANAQGQAASPVGDTKLGRGTGEAPLAVFNANAATLGAIPDGGPACGADGAPRDVTFTVTGMPTAPGAVSVSMTFGPAHTWRSDLTARLIAPNGTGFNLFRYMNVTTALGCGADRDFSGPYVFTDTAAGTNIWLIATNPTTPGSYRTTADGGAGQVSPAPVTNLTAAFAGIPTSNGTWILRITDGGAADLGTISAASLTLTAPLASGVEVSGRVLTANGRGITNARVNLTDVGGVTRIATTGRNGMFSFSDVEPGRTYTVSVSSRRFAFAPQIIQPQDNISGLDFYAQ